MPSKYTIRLRLTILFFTILSLAVAGLNSANARFAIILRDRARSDINPTNSILSNKFQWVQRNTLIDVVITALATAAFAIYGAAITFHPSWLRENDGVSTFGLLQAVPGFLMVVTGGYLADQVHGYQTSFEKFGADDGIPYYGIMYYGGVAQAAYGSVLVLLAIAILSCPCNRPLRDEETPGSGSRDGSGPRMGRL
ncbi:hypothetical protein ACJ41O_013825 [Fusarium nematophilum]